MSHQRFPSTNPAREPHSISLKVLRQSRRTAATQPPPSSTHASPTKPTTPADHTAASDPAAGAPPFGSAYVGEHFSCTLRATREHADAASPSSRTVRDVKIEAEMKTPGSSGTVHKITLAEPTGDSAANSSDGSKGTDLGASETLERIVNFDLKDPGNHVLAVTVSYYEATETSGRTRTFKKLYQFICKASLVVRTKVGALPAAAAAATGGAGGGRWVLEAQLENCCDEVMQLDRVVLDLEPGLGYTDCNWVGDSPVLHPGDVEQVCFVVEEEGPRRAEAEDGRVVFGVLGIGWAGEQGNTGFLATGRLGTRAMKR